jgi:hypothetical protein
MSQRDLVAELGAARVAAPPQLRERVRMIAASAEPAPARRFFNRRSLVLLVPVAAAVAGTIIVTQSGKSRQQQTLVLARPPVSTVERSGVPGAAQVQHGAVAKSSAGATDSLATPAPSTGRAQRYSASIGLRVASPRAVSDVVKDALRLTARLGGHPTQVHASSEGKAGSADLVLRIPRVHVQEAVTRLSQLGTITSEQVDVQDLQPAIDTTARRIARLQTQLATLRAEPQTTDRDRQIAAITAQVERLQRGEAATLRSARFATVSLHIATPTKVQPVHHGHGPLHGLGVSAYWTGIGAVYAVAFGVPLLLLVALFALAARTVRRRRVDALLSRP